MGKLERIGPERQTSLVRETRGVGYRKSGKLREGGGNARIRLRHRLKKSNWGGKKNVRFCGKKRVRKGGTTREEKPTEGK